ncbi:antigen 5 like allergen Cul n 1 isoform X1 [Drosophila innubila]|uniref:antigen 5 like allergen Cul n 1 isoform X1 n=1 Tax=Drosophila innubila TaxID=198719 RepID=UPI00148DEE96|nr:antigen 5 like allergen Cul n 1 isoform X1 [Drosophila innubila]
MKIPVVISLLICLMSEAFGSPDYCDPDLCKYNGVKNHAACNKELKFDTSCSENASVLKINQSVILAAHNAVRQKWASGKGKVRIEACRMATVSWDDELAKLAEYNVMQCAMKHDCSGTYKFKMAGQNLAKMGFLGSPSKINDFLESSIANWESEERNVNADILAACPENYNEPAIGHFIQLVQELNVAVGCAVSNYNDERNYNTFLLACNYGRSTIPNTPVYRGCKKAAIECESGTNPDYPALCSLKEKVKFN